MPTPNTAGTTTNTPRQGWEKSCDCGFLLRDYNKGEFVNVVNTHLKTSHGTAALSEKDVLAGAKAIKMM
jgi:predicted small metal-binding protein